MRSRSSSTAGEEAHGRIAAAVVLSALTLSVAAPATTHAAPVDGITAGQASTSTGPSRLARVDPGLERAVARDGSARVIVVFRAPGAGVAAARDVRRRVLARGGRGFDATARWDAVPAVPGRVTAGGLSRLAADPEVRAIGLDGGGGGAAGRESLPLIRADAAHAGGFTGSGVTVAVLDSGIDRSHPDLAEALAGEQCFTPPAGCPNRSAQQAGAGSAQDDHGHGTNVAGIVASRGRIAPRGVAPASRIVAVKVLDRNNRFQSASQIISALNWIALNRPDVKVVNMSLGSDLLFVGTCDNAEPWTMAYASAVAALRSRGVTVFASSMNTGSATSLGAPACIADVVAVGAVYDSAFGAFQSSLCSDATEADKVACFSNGGSALDLLAPGAEFTSTGLGSRTSTFRGTSQAAPAAAAAAAILLHARPSLTPGQVESTLKAAGKPVLDRRNGRTTPRVDVLAAVSGAPRPPAGASGCVVPRVIGRPLSAARTTIRSANCTVGRVTRAFSKAKKGRVLSQAPRGGTQRPRGATVRLVVSKGTRRR
jgi:hypothetical protein